MVEGNAGFTTTRRGALRTGAIGLGGLTGAIALSGSGVAAAAEPAAFDAATAAAVAGVSVGGFFLLLDQIPGDSVDDKHDKWIDALSFSFGASNTSSLTGSGWSSSKPSMQQINVVAYQGSQSPLLFLRTLNGKHLASALFQGISAGETPRKFMEIELKDVLVGSYSASGSGGSSPTESFSLAFGSIRYSIYLQGPAGAAGQEITTTWNVRTSTGA
jgi:type VI secretion system secreted protein Hcp